MALPVGSHKWPDTLCLLTVQLLQCVDGSNKQEPSFKVRSTFISICGDFAFPDWCSLSQFQSYNHLIEGDLNILLVVFQAIVAVICVETCKRLKWIEYPSFNISTAQQWAPVNIFFCMMLFTGMAALQYNSVPMVTIFKNVTNI